MVMVAIFFVGAKKVMAKIKGLELKDVNLLFETPTHFFLVSYLGRRYCVGGMELLSLVSL
jgi:hypothetical protein